MSQSSQTSRRGSSPVQNQAQQQPQQPGAASNVEHSEGGVRKRIQRSTSPTSTASTISIDARKPVAATSHQQFSNDNLRAQNGSSVQGVFSTGSQSAVSGERRKGRVRKEVIPLPDQPGQVRQVRHRMPTPEPDTLERVYIQRTAPEIVEEITEIPMTPPPIVREQNVVEPSGPPQIVKRTIRVPPRGGGFTGQQQAGASVQYNDNLLSAGGYNVNQQQASTAFSGGFSAPTNFTGGFESFGANNFQQQAPLVFTVGGPGSPSPVMPPMGCQPAFCFYI